MGSYPQVLIGILASMTGCLSVGTYTITGAAGADQMDGGAGADEFVQTAGATAAGTAATIAAPGDLTDGDTITVAGADIITNFTGGTDVMNTTDGTAAVVVVSGSAYDNTVNGGNVIVRGDFAGGVFTIDTAVGADAMFMDLTAAISNANPNGSGTAVTVFAGQGANIAAIATGNWV